MTCNSGHVLEQEVFVHFDALLFIEGNREFQCLFLAFYFSLLDSVGSEFECVVSFFLNGEDGADLRYVVFSLDYVIDKFVFGEDFEHFFLVFGELSIVENYTSANGFLLFFFTLAFFLTAGCCCFLLEADV